MSHFKPAQLEGVGVFTAIAGSSRTGKTLSALRMAKGMAGKTGKIAAIDTEGKRMSHYSKEFPFDVANLESPFNANRFVELAKAAQADGYAVMVVDSFSLEWSGAGGVLAEYTRQMAAVNNAQNKSDQIWNRVKGPGSEHKLMMNEFLQMTMPIIFCLRANEVSAQFLSELAKQRGGGWKVEQDKRFLYEWTIGLTLHPDTPGMPRYDIVDAKGKPMWKVPDIHRGLFPENELITERAGEALQAWRNSDAARAAGSAAVREAAPAESEGNETADPQEQWLGSLLDDVSDCTTRLALTAVWTRADVKSAMADGAPSLKERINAMFAHAGEEIKRRTE